MTEPNERSRPLDRRGFVRRGLGLSVAAAAGVGGWSAWVAAARGHAERYVWQIDPDLCIACRKCQTHCVLDPSAVKAVQCFALCGYCDVCTGYFPTKDFVLDTGAENHLCPTGAIRRRFVEQKSGERFFEYTIDEALCIACGKCVEGCRLMNGSLYLQVRHDRCLNCSECAIAVACPAQAFRRVRADEPVILGRAMREAEASLRRQRRSDSRGSAPRGSDPA
mgnify:CR=1 FL=1